MPLIRGDIGNWSEVFNVVQEHNIDAIFHLAAMKAQWHPLRMSKTKEVCVYG